MGNYRKLWWTLIGVLGVTFCLLGWFGREVYREAPPIPAQVVSADGAVLFTEKDILDGQTAWQSVGGMQLGSIWGHGAYQAPDWSADWLHRELTTWLDLAAQDEFGQAYAEISEEQQAVLRHRLKNEYRQNQVRDGVLVLSARRQMAVQQTAAYYDNLFGSDPAMQQTRKNFAMKEDTLPDAGRREQMTRFFFWTSWVAATERPGQDATYTNNWPHEPLIGNQPTGENLMWSVISVILLVAGIGFLVWAWAFLRKQDEEEPVAPARDPLTTIPLTPSQRALGKYLFLVVALFGFQVFLGGATAHYTVEGQDFYGFPLSRWFPYTLLRTWHLQSALF
ncbi:MAG: nitric-oxide reductase large subunit, partial [Aquabacterium sp.]|nr:nitric-oxide reductase large subunit [Aquabacterium sp.]